jgi:hypothetical protein
MSFFLPFLLQFSASGSIAGSIFNLFLEIIGSIVTIADAISQILYIIFTAAGIQLPLVVWRIVTIVIGIISFWRFVGNMTWTVKVLVAIIVISTVVSVFGGSGFGSGIFGNWFSSLTSATG